MAKQRRGAYKPLSQKAIKRIMAHNPTDQTQAISAEVVQDALPYMRLTRHMEYDSLNPEEAIKAFIIFLNDAKSRYDEDLRLIEEYQLQKQDLDHYAEMAENLDRTAGHAYYRKVRDMWRNRRQCKNEAELLKPVIDFLESNKEALNQLAQVLGRCRMAKETIDQREYIVRTSILEDIIVR